MIAAEIASTLKKKDKIAIVSHVMPDGDSIGSMLALYSALSRIGKKVDVFSSDSVPGIYSFLPCSGIIKNCSEISSYEYEVLVVLDCGSMDRTGICSKLWSKINTSINIDHHITNSLFANLNLVDTNASATGEIIYGIIKLMGIDILQEEALCLYTSILTDTGCFRYSNTTPVTHEIVGALISTKIDFGSVHDLIYRNFEFNTIKAMGKALSSIEVFCSGRIAFMQFLQKDYEDLGFREVNTSDFIDYARDINSVEVAAFAKEIAPLEFKVSLRSKKVIDVRNICEKFGGGGHIRAAGCTMGGTIHDIKDTILQELQMALRNDDL